MLRVQVIPFVGTWCQLVEFANLPGQSLLFALQAVLRAASFVQCFLGGAPSLPARAQLVQRHASVGVQQAAHRVGPGQALPGVLAVDVDQLVGDFFQLRCGGRAAIDPGAALALHVNRAPQQQVVVNRQAFVFKPGQQRRGAVEGGADLAALCAFPHHGGVCAGAQCEL